MVFFFGGGGGGGGGGEVNKMHYGLCKNGEFATLETRRELGQVKFRKDFWDCYHGQVKQLVLFRLLFPSRFLSCECTF